jgi:hypothetical protein
LSAVSPQLAAALADAILVLHLGIAAFVVLVTAAVLAGGPLGWRWVRGRALRVIHLALLLVVALQAWLGQLCVLTIWEQDLRKLAGQDTYSGSFIQHWLSRLLFFEAPWWVFVLAYSALAMASLACWWRWPPRRRPARDADGRRPGGRE